MSRRFGTNTDSHRVLTTSGPSLQCAVWGGEGRGGVCLSPALFKETKQTKCRALMTMNCKKWSAMSGYEIDPEYSF